MEHPGKSNSSTMTNAGISSGIRGGEFENLSRDRLVYLTTCLIGHHVEVQVTNGSVLTGIFHASNAGDFGVVLKMAHLIKDVSTRGRRAASDLDSKALIIPAHEVVQVVAKDVSITSDEQSIEVQGLKHRDIMLDSYLSQSHHVELERELQPWMPDEDDPQCPELESIFDSLWTGLYCQCHSAHSIVHSPPESRLLVLAASPRPSRPSPRLASPGSPRPSRPSPRLASPRQARLALVAPRRASSRPSRPESSPRLASP